MLLFERGEAPSVCRVSAPSLVIDIIKHLPRQLNIVVRKLSNLRIVGSQNLGLIRNAKFESRNHVHDEQDQASHSERVATTCKGVGELITHLHPVSVNPTTIDNGLAIESGNSLAGEEGGANVADEAADTMYGKDVEGIVNVEEELDLGRIV